MSWTKEMDTVLVKNNNERTNEELGRMVNMSVVSVIRRKSKLNISKPYYNRNVSEWSDEEVAVLKEYHDRLPIKTIAKKLNRSVPKTTRKMVNLGLYKRGKYNNNHKDRIWSDEMIQHLKDNYKHASTRDIANYVGLTVKQVNAKKYKMGLTGNGKVSIQWTDKMEQHVKKHAGEVSLDKMARHLNVTIDQLRFKADYLNVSLKMKQKSDEAYFWSKNAVDFIKNNYKTMSDAEMAKRLGMSKASLVGKRNRLGLKRRTVKKQNKWTQEKVDYVVKHYASKPNRVLAEDLGLDATCVANKKQQLKVQGVIK